MEHPEGFSFRDFFGLADHGKRKAASYNLAAASFFAGSIKWKGRIIECGLS